MEYTNRHMRMKIKVKARGTVLVTSTPVADKLLDSPLLLLLVCSATTDDGRDRCRKPEPQW